MLKNLSQKPTTSLRKYIDRIYIFEKTEKDEFRLPAVLPGTGLEMLFHLETSLAVNRCTLPVLHTVCPRKVFHFDQCRKASFISVRFKSGAFRHFSPISFSDLNDKFISAQSLWGYHGEMLIERLFKIASVEDKINEIEDFLMNCLRLYHNNSNDKWDVIIDDLYYNFDSHTITQLAKKSSLSVRQFEREFKSQFGLTPKEFQKITRFQNVVKDLLLNKKEDYLHTVLDNGYFDQSHFIKEFKSLTNKTPGKYFILENFDNHFYHQSIHM